MIFQLAFKFVHRGAQFYITRQVVPNGYRNHLEQLSSFIARYVQFILCCESIERPLIVSLLMFLELRLVGAIQIIQLSGSLSESGPRNFGTENNFPSFYVSQKGLAHIYKKRFIFFQLFLLCYKPKLHFGRTEVADRDQKGKIHRFCEACYVP